MSPSFSLMFQVFFLWHRSYRSSHVFEVEGFVIANLIFWVFSSFCVVIYVLVIRVVVSPPNPHLVCCLMFEFGDKAVVRLGLFRWAKLISASPLVRDLL